MHRKRKCCFSLLLLIGVFTSVAGWGFIFWGVRFSIRVNRDISPLLENTVVLNATQEFNFSTNFRNKLILIQGRLNLSDPLTQQWNARGLIPGIHTVYLERTVKVLQCVETNYTRRRYEMNWVDCPEENCVVDDWDFSPGWRSDCNLSQSEHNSRNMILIYSAGFLNKKARIGRWKLNRFMLERIKNSDQFGEADISPHARLLQLWNLQFNKSKSHILSRQRKIGAIDVRYATSGRDGLKVTTLSKIEPDYSLSSYLTSRYDFHEVCPGHLSKQDFFHPVLQEAIEWQWVTAVAGCFALFIGNLLVFMAFFVGILQVGSSDTSRTVYEGLLEVSAKFLFSPCARIPLFYVTLFECILPQTWGKALVLKRMCLIFLCTVMLKALAAFGRGFATHHDEVLRITGLILMWTSLALTVVLAIRALWKKCVVTKCRSNSNG